MMIVVQPTATKLPIKTTARVSIRNLGPATIYLENNSSVMPWTGFPLYQGEAYELPTDAVEYGELWAITAEETGAADVRILTVG